MAEGELFKLFSRFPTQKHVIEICKMGQGKETCRYLAVGSSWECLKTNCSLRKNINKRVEINEIIAKGDNCEGPLGLIIKEQEKLRGRKAIYARPYFTMTSKLKKIEIEDTLRIIMDWEDKKGVEKGAEFEFDINDLNIALNSKSVNFFQNCGNFIKQFTIYF
ncbi:hypothetical protein KKA24_02160 [Patescibacteria group bacterium]|nr:hypothetical protein [Patescibacteria group bacterium]